MNKPEKIETLINYLKRDEKYFDNDRIVSVHLVNGDWFEACEMLSVKFQDDRMWLEFAKYGGGRTYKLIPIDRIDYIESNCT